VRSEDVPLAGDVVGIGAGVGVSDLLLNMLSRTGGSVTPTADGGCGIELEGIVGGIDEPGGVVVVPGAVVLPFAPGIA
jgi:hypothetical protein